MPPLHAEVVSGASDRDDMARYGLESPERQRSLVSFEPARGGAHIGAADVGDPSATLFEEMSGRELADLHVIAADEIGVHSFQPAVDEHARRILNPDPHQGFRGRLAGR